MDIIRSAPPTVQHGDTLTVAAAQIAPVFLDRLGTTQKIISAMDIAAQQGAALCAFGEAFLPGYPLWVEQTDGARFESDVQKAWYDRYSAEGVDIARGDLDPICEAAKRLNIAIYLGVMEKAKDRGGVTLFCSLVYIDRAGIIASVHRKLQPTYEERLVWGAGDGYGLRCHDLGPFVVGGLNCWENWMPLARASFYGQGETLHIATWPGGVHNTQTLTPVIAREGRSFVVSVSSIVRGRDIPPGLPGADDMRADGDALLTNGGSCIAGPDGNWIIPPVVGREAILIATLDAAQIRRERLTFDPAGHYSRPDVLTLSVDRRRQSTLRLRDSD